MSLGEVDQALMSLRDNMNNPPPYQARIEDPYLFGHIFDEETGSVRTHRMAQMDNYAYPMIQRQADGTLKDFGDDKFGAWEAAKKAGNFKKFDTIPEAEAYAAGGYKTPELEYYGKVESKHARTGNRQSVEPDYGPQGLRNVAPVIEFGVGLAGKAVRSTKMYSDKIVDKWTKFRTPDKVYHGGPSGLTKLETPYDLASKPTKLGHRREIPEDAFIKAGMYTAKKPWATNMYSRERVVLGKKGQEIVGGKKYEVDISEVNKVYNFAKPSKYMQKEIKKEIKRLGDKGESLKKHQMENLLSGDSSADTLSAMHISSTQRRFLEKHGYDAWKHKEAGSPVYVLFRPEKYKIKELP